MKQTQPAEISHPHDLLVKRFLSDADIAADLFRNYLAAEWVELIDFDALELETTETVGDGLAELRSDLQFSARFRNYEKELKVFVFLEHRVPQQAA